MDPLPTQVQTKIFSTFGMRTKLETLILTIVNFLPIKVFKTCKNINDALMTDTSHL